MSSGQVDPSKWKILSFPMGNGETWAWEEPKARFEAKNGGLSVTVDPFTRKHDHVHMFDDPQQLYGSTRTLPVSRNGEAVFEVELGEITLGFGLFTLKPIDPARGSVSTHGQGATGIWKNFQYFVV